MEKKNNTLKLTLSIITLIFGVLILIGQLPIRNIDRYLSNWYLLIILWLSGGCLASGIIKKAPLFYVFAFLFAGLYLSVSLAIRLQALSFYNVFMIVPLATSIGVVVSQITCEWHSRTFKLGILSSLIFSYLLSSTILEISKFTVPMLIIILGIAGIVVSIFQFNSKKNVSNDEHYVTPTKDKTINEDNEK